MLLDESMSNLSPSFILCFFAVPIAMVTSTNRAPSSYQATKMCPVSRDVQLYGKKKSNRVESFGILKSCCNDIQVKISKQMNILKRLKKQNISLLKQQARKVLKIYEKSSFWVHT